jgi:hypothetical protein
MRIDYAGDDSIPDECSILGVNGWLSSGMLLKADGLITDAL